MIVRGRKGDDVHESASYCMTCPAGYAALLGGGEGGKNGIARQRA